MSAYKFLQSVLGNDGAQALTKAAERAPVLHSVLVPRTIVSWLGTITRINYEGEIPGLENSYIAITKNEGPESISGAMTIGDSVYSFNNEHLLHVAAAVGVAIGIGPQRLNPSLKGVELSKLGKSIDLLVKSKFLINELKKNEPLSKAITNIAPGTLIDPSTRTYDYSHVLSPEHRAAGYTMDLSHSDADTLHATLYHNGQEIGQVQGEHAPSNRAVSIDLSDIEDAHQGRGLGQAGYEAIMAHAKHHLGAQWVTGGIHSSMASRVHQKLSNKHGMDYAPKPTPNPNIVSPTPGAYDNRHGPYQYALKEEMPMDKEEKPGQAAPPRGPLEAQPPMTPKKQPQIPKIGKRELKITKSESERKCPECGGKNFNEDKFVGCLCWRSLAKSVQTTSNGNDYYIKLIGNEWDEDSIRALVLTFKR